MVESKHLSGGGQGGYTFYEDGKPDLKQVQRAAGKVLLDNTHIPVRVQHLLESSFPDLKDNPRVTELLARIHNCYYPSHDGRKAE